MLSDRVKYFGESQIREMTRLANRHGAINLGQGMPDFDPPQAIKDAACKAIRDGFNQYAITWGAPDLRLGDRGQGPVVQRHRLRPGRERHRLLRRHRVHDGHHARHGQSRRRGDRLPALLRELRPGRDALRGQAGRGSTLRRPDGSSTPMSCGAAFTPRTRPSSSTRPTTRRARSSPAIELTRSPNCVSQHDVIAVTDEIYEYIPYTDRPHISIASLPGMAERTVTISGLSKTFSITGWRLGYCIAPRAHHQRHSPGPRFPDGRSPASPANGRGRGLAIGPKLLRPILRRTTGGVRFFCPTWPRPVSNSPNPRAYYVMADASRSESMTTWRSPRP